MGFCSCSPMLVLSEVNGAGDCRSWQQRQQKWRKSISRLDWRKDESSDWGRELFLWLQPWCFFFFSPSPHPPSLPVSSPPVISPSSNVYVPCCYTISHLFKVFNRSQSFSMLHLIKRSSVFIRCVRIVLRVWEHAYPCTHSSLQCQIGKRNEPRARHNEMLIICFGGSCYFFLFFFFFSFLNLSVWLLISKNLTAKSS